MHKQSCWSNKKCLCKMVCDWQKEALGWTQMDFQHLILTSLTVSPRKKCILFAASEILHRRYIRQVGVESFQWTIELKSKSPSLLGVDGTCSVFKKNKKNTVIWMDKYRWEIVILNDFFLISWFAHLMQLQLYI